MHKLCYQQSDNSLSLQLRKATEKSMEVKPLLKAIKGIKQRIYVVIVIESLKLQKKR